MSKEKFVSVFRINGEPILPPLMTMERRFEMQMYREKAIQLERKLIKDGQEKKVKFTEEQSSSPADSSKCVDGDGGGGDNLIITEVITTPLTPNEEERASSGVIEQCETIIPKRSEKDTQERMMKLTKSETICFDNRKSCILRALTENQYELFENASPENREIYLYGMYDESKKVSMYLPVQKKPVTPLKIPSINIDPPTPQAEPNKIFDGEVANANEIVNDNEKTKVQSSSQEDNAGFSTTQNRITANESVHDNKAKPQSSSQEDNAGFSTTQNRITGVVARGLHFELVCDEPLNSTSEDCCNTTEALYTIRSPQRSATSPSLKSLCDTIGTCSLATSPRDDTSTQTSIVRSNSFTLDEPSKALIDHMSQQNRHKTSNKSDHTIRSSTPTQRTDSKQRCAPSPSAWRDTIESKAKRVQKKVETKSNARTLSNVRSKPKPGFNNYTANAAPIWNNKIQPLKLKRSPYDTKLTQGSSSSKSSNSKSTTKPNKHQPTSKSQKNFLVKKSSSSTTYTVDEESKSDQLPNCVGDFNDIDQRHREKLLNLIAQQQEEQRRLQLIFENQQRILLEQLNNEKYRQYYTDAMNLSASLHIDGVGLLSPSSVSANAMLNEMNMQSSSVSYCNYMSPVYNGVLCDYSPAGRTCDMSVNMPVPPNIPHPIPQRTVQLDVSTSMYSNSPELNAIHNNIMDSNMQSREIAEPPDQSKSNVDSDSEKINAAATIINAYARGFLVRRLFQTEQIQRIIQTIRDTLIFVLNLHMETIENAEEASTPSNIKLKARLLQQLSSASRTLHLIFFQTSIKERMAIISRDRKRIKAKLLSRSLKRSPRVA